MLVPLLGLAAQRDQRGGEKRPRNVSAPVEKPLFRVEGVGLRVEGSGFCVCGLEDDLHEVLKGWLQKFEGGMEWGRKPQSLKSKV